MREDRGAIDPGSSEAALDAGIPEVDIEFVDRLPGGRVVMPVEQENRITWLVVKKNMTRQARDEMVEGFQLMIHNRLWEQRWKPS